MLRLLLFPGKREKLSFKGLRVGKREREKILRVKKLSGVIKLCLLKIVNTFQVSLG